MQQNQLVEPLEAKRYQSATNLEQAKPPLALLDLLEREAFGTDVFL